MTSARLLAQGEAQGEERDHTDIPKIYNLQNRPAGVNSELQPTGSVQYTEWSLVPSSGGVQAGSLRDDGPAPVCCTTNREISASYLTSVCQSDASNMVANHPNLS